MTSFHHNFGVSEHIDPLDQVLHETVADIKCPAKPETYLHSSAKSMSEPHTTGGLKVAGSERFEAE